MCLIVLAWQCHPKYPLIVAANRDEYYRRPTEAAHLWAPPSRVLAGRDLLAGGTWLGITPKGKFAAVTNYREFPHETAPLSRGDLTTGFLNSDIDIHQYAQKSIDTGDQYSGFNLLLSEANQLTYCSNRRTNIQILPPGVYSLSNHLLDSPWPKAIHVKKALKPLLKDQSIHVDEILKCLQRREAFPDEHLPNTGVGIELERVLSPPFIVSPDYGTRCSTVVLRNNSGKTILVEQSYLNDGAIGEKKSFCI
jgi:uncharacterized protein with NRDE domain